MQRRFEISGRHRISNKLGLSQFLAMSILELSKGSPQTERES